VLFVVGLLASSPVGAANDRNWIAVHIYDGIHPMTEEQSFPEALGSLEIINQLKTRRKLERDLGRFLNPNGRDHGLRSGEGHYMVWLHFSDRFLGAHPIDRAAIGEEKFIFRDRETDIFTAWSGDTNIVALLREGIRGLARPLRDSTTGTLSGRFQGFADAVELGEADGAAGWFIDDEGAARALATLDSYAGRTLGYSFLSPIEDKPNAPYESPNARLVNGNNCGDYAYTALVASGAVTRAEVEAIKIGFWYPSKYFDRPLPLRGVGARGARWLAKHPDVTVLPSNVMVKLGWLDLLFKPTGLEFFDKEALAGEIRAEWPRFERARIWDHERAIAWMREHADFVSKGIVTELLPASRDGRPITWPERTVAATPANSWRLSTDFAHYRKIGQRIERRKLRRDGLGDGAAEALRALQDSLKVH
jgi:hypothetical protein